MENYNYALLNQDEYEGIKPYLQKAFDAFTPRSAFISKSKKIDKINNLTLENHESPNILMKNTRFQSYEGHAIPEFSEAFTGFSGKELFAQKLTEIENYVAQYIAKCSATFLTFSTNFNGAQKGAEHLHPLMNQDRCNVWSFVVPLYIQPEIKQKHQFWYHWNDSLFNPRYYVDYSRLKKDQIDYSSFQIPTNGKVFSIQFDGSRTAHYIDYTDHLYAWFVFDGVEYKEVPRKMNNFIIEHI